MNIALVLAKRGSEGAPDKNVYQFRGKTLLDHTIDDVRRQGLFEEVYVTTNSDEIATIAGRAGAKAILRPDSLADNSRYVDTVNHAIEQMGQRPSTITIPMVVQPIREGGIFGRMLAMHGPDVDGVITVSPFDSSLDWIYTRSKKTSVLIPHTGIRYGGDIARRDDLFVIDNAIVSFTYESWRRSDGFTPWPYLGRRIIGVVQNKPNKNYHVDINVPDDIEWLEFISTFPQWKNERIQSA